MAKADLSVENITADGGKLFKGSFTTTTTIRTKVLENIRDRREKITFSCLSSQNGTWVIYDVDEDGDYAQVISIAVVANTLNIYTHNHVSLRAFCDFTPAAAPGTESLSIRAYTAGFGARS